VVARLQPTFQPTPPAVSFRHPLTLYVTGSAGRANSDDIPTRRKAAAAEARSGRVRPSGSSSSSLLNPPPSPPKASGE
jgi:hypothetical protein